MLSKPEQKDAAVKPLPGDAGRCARGVPAPSGAADRLDGDASVDFSADFRKRMLTVCSTLVDLEAALAKGRRRRSQTIYRTLGKQKKEGHDTYL